MNNKEVSIELECVFCSSTDFIIPYQGYYPNHGELLKCANCGRLNDFTSINDFTIKKTCQETEDYAHREIEKMFKKSGFKFK